MKNKVFLLVLASMMTLTTACGSTVAAESGSTSASSVSNAAAASNSATAETTEETTNASEETDKATTSGVIFTNDAVNGVTANCTCEAYGQTIRSFSYEVKDPAAALNLTADDFELQNAVFDGNETHKPFTAKAKSVSVSGNKLTVEVEPFYPAFSFTEDGYWILDCKDDNFDISAADSDDIAYSDPVVDYFELFTAEKGTAKMNCLLYSPENTDSPQPIVIFNSGGTGVSNTGVYSANFATSFAKDEFQEMENCYVLYPQRNEGEVDDQTAAIVEVVQNLIDEGKVDPNRVYMSGESAGSIFTMQFVQRYPDFLAAIAIFDGGPLNEELAATETLDEAMKVNIKDDPWNDADLKQLAESGTKVMLVQSIGDTTSKPIQYAYVYQKLLDYGMKAGNDLVWHYYTAQDFNNLCQDRTEWEAMSDSEYVTDPITGITTYNYQDGKLHNSSFPAANDISIKLWLFDQQKGEYKVELNEKASASTEKLSIDYAQIPEEFTKVTTLEDAPGVPAGSKTTLTVYTNDDQSKYYVGFMTPFQKEMQYIEGIVVGKHAHVIMDCSGNWWTNDAENAILPYIMEQTDIAWEDYTGANS